ncbi:MAG: TMEM14 family protein [Microcoleaceae cyanobacterium]
MNLGSWAVIAYGALALVGGIIGFVKVRSKVSLLSGGLSGLLLILAGVMALQGQTAGLAIAIPVTLALICVFIVRIINTGKWMPGIVMIVTGVIGLSFMLYQLLYAQPVGSP